MLIAMCEKGVQSMGFWGYFFLFIGGMVLLTYLSSEWREYKTKRKRETTMPILDNSIVTGQDYKIILSDGRIFEPVQILGSVEQDDTEFSLGGWEGTLVLLQTNHKKIYVRKTAVRIIEEL